MKTVFKDSLVRVIDADRLESYLEAGWTEDSTKPKSKKVKVEIPEVESQPTVEVPDAANTLDDTYSKGE